jgi:hypothetical protein
MEQAGDGEIIVDTRTRLLAGLIEIPAEEVDESI